MASNKHSLGKERLGNFERLMRKRHVRWAWITVACLIVLLIFFIGMAKLVADLVSWFHLSGPRVMTMGIASMAFAVIASFVCGQIANRAIRGSWDMWIAELGPNEVQMLISSLQDRHKELTGIEPLRKPLTLQK